MLFDRQEIERLKKLTASDRRFADALIETEQSVSMIDEDYVAQFEQNFPLWSDAGNAGDAEMFAKWSKTAYRINYLFRPLALCALVGDNHEQIDWAKRLLLAFCKTHRWVSQGRRQTPVPWESDLITGDFGAQVSLVFHMLEDYYTPEERTKIKDALWENSFLPVYKEWISPQTHIHALDTMGHNWWNVCISGAGMALLTAGPGRENYREYLEQVINALKEAFLYPGNVLQNKFPNYGPDGDFIEYTSYMLYNYSNLSLFIASLEKAEGLVPFDHLGIMDKIMDFLIMHTEFVDGGYRIPEFGDTRGRIFPRDAYTILFLAGKYQNGAAVSYFNRTLGKISTPLDMYFYPLALEPASFDDYPKAKRYNGTGFAVIRDGYADDDMFFAMKTGGAWCHSHRDTGTFVLTAAGRQFVVDSGRCTYSKPLYNGFYTTPQAHSVITVNGRGMNQRTEYHGTHTMGCFPVLLDAGEYRYLLADCTAPYADLYTRFFRHVIFTGGYIFMADDIQALQGNEGAAAEWLLQFKGNHNRTGNISTIENDGKIMHVHTLFPGDTTFTVCKGWRGEIQAKGNTKGVNSEDWINPEGEYLSVNTTLDDDCRAQYFTMFVPPGTKEVTAVQTRREGDCLVTEVENTEAKYRIIINLKANGSIMHSNSCAVCGNIETDAYLTVAAYSADGKLCRASVHNGSYLRLDGKTLYSSALKVDATIQYGDAAQFTVEAAADTICSFASGTGLEQRRLTKGTNRF